MVTTNKARKPCARWGLSPLLAAQEQEVTANICTPEGSKILRMFGCILFSIVDFLSCQEAKPIRIHLAYKNTTEMTQISLQDSSRLMSLEISARKVVIQSAGQSHAKTAGPLQHEGLETCQQISAAFFVEILSLFSFYMLKLKTERVTPVRSLELQAMKLWLCSY